MGGLVTDFDQMPDDEPQVPDLHEGPLEHPDIQRVHSQGVVPKVGWEAPEDWNEGEPDDE